MSMPPANADSRQSAMFECIHLAFGVNANRNHSGSPLIPTHEAFFTLREPAGLYARKTEGPHAEFSANAEITARPKILKAIKSIN
jgi:hypothetical protein